MTVETDYDDKENIHENVGTVGIKISQKAREHTDVCREQREFNVKERYMSTITSEFEKKNKVSLKERLNHLNRKVDNISFSMDENNVDGVKDDSSRIVSTFRYMTTYKQPEANMSKKRDQWHTTSVTKSDMCQSLLKRGSYVNDSVIRYYRGLLLERELARSTVQKSTTVAWIYDSLFMTKSKIGFQIMTGSSRRVPDGNIFHLKRLLIPLNIAKTHWFLAVVVFVEKTIRIYDSLPGGGDGRQEYLNKILDYIATEHVDVYGFPMAKSEWTLVQCRENNDWVPKQILGGNDCGVFLCLMMDVIMMGEETRVIEICPFDVYQNGREWIAKSILSSKLAW
jgi:Ulp1 family protease